jgi:hypothetical protein
LDLRDVAYDIVDPWDVDPYKVWSFDFPITEEHKLIGGAAYDTASGKIYVSQLRMDGFDAYPLVHVFTLRGPHVYVDAAASSSNKNGASWSTAFSSLQDALAISHSGDTLHIAEGTYYPDDGANQSAGNREETFRIKDGVVILAGYPAGGGIRDPESNTVILSGDIDHNDVMVPAHSPADISGLNSYNVVVCYNGMLDGMIISGGKANAADTILHHSGAGIHFTGDAALNDCVIIGNIASGTGMNGKGGGFYVSSGTIKIRNSLFEGNEATDQGSAWYAADGSVVVMEDVEVKD